jgi:hypothetical protein
MVLNVEGTFSAKVNSILEMEAYFSLLLSSGPIRNGKITYFHCNIRPTYWEIALQTDEWRFLLEHVN